MFSDNSSILMMSFSILNSELLIVVVSVVGVETSSVSFCSLFAFTFRNV